MVWHIFKKDFRLLWPFAAAAALFDWLSIIASMQADPGFMITGAAPVWNLLVMSQLLSSGILLAMAVQLDSLPGIRQDWLVRPIERRDLLLAKLLFALAMVQFPIFLGDLAEALAYGFSFGQSFAAAFFRSAYLFCGFYVPLMAFASITRNLMEASAAMFAGLVVFAGFIQAIYAFGPWYWRFSDTAAAAWVVKLAMLLVALLGAAGVLALQYFRRRTLAARWLTAALTVTYLLVSFSPWQPAFAIQQRFSPQPGAASAVNLAFDPSIGRGTARRLGSTDILLPIRISGLAADELLRTDMATARLVEPDGKAHNAGEVSVPLSGGGAAHADFIIPAALFNQLRNRPVRLELDYSFTLHRFAGEYAIAAPDGRETLPELGRCQARLTATALELNCVKAGEPSPCATFHLEPIPHDWQPDAYRCAATYSPFPLQYEPDALRRSEASFTSHSRRYLMQTSTGPSLLRGSHITIRFYQPLEHFTRHLVIPQIRLGDWLPLLP